MRTMIIFKVLQCWDLTTTVSDNTGQTLYLLSLIFYILCIFFKFLTKLDEMRLGKGNRLAFLCKLWCHQRVDCDTYNI